MEQKHEVLQNESELRVYLDNLYQKTKDAINEEQLPKFKDLVEVASSEVVILTAIHNLKANTGSITAGSDGETMRLDILQKEYPKVIRRVKQSFENYMPLPVRRVLIPKEDKDEKRPLGIPAIIDRIVQECVKMVLEPIMEAQFFEHSYGFRPYRNADMAMGRIGQITLKTGYHWVVEGDIKGFFDNVNHTILIKRLWHMGVRDRRMLMIIKAMLKAGIMNQIKYNDLGVPQGGIISPLLANVYLDAMDQWITREWEHKKLRPDVSKDSNIIRAKKRYSNLKPCYLVRYADDWVLFCETKEHAIKFKNRITKYLKNNLKIELSENKTLVTNIKKKQMRFLGFDYKMVRGDSRIGWVPKSKPNSKRLKKKVKQIHRNVQRLRKFKLHNKEGLIHEINRINAQIRGMINYYQSSSWVNKELAKYAPILKYAAYKSLQKFGGTWGPANEMSNLISVHSNYKSYVAYADFNNFDKKKKKKNRRKKNGRQTSDTESMKIGITGLDFCKYKENTFKTQEETPYTAEGRAIYEKRTGKKPLIARADNTLKLHTSSLIATKRTSKKYNFEYFLNKAYTFNRDKGKCKICNGNVKDDDVHFHHINPCLPLNRINRVPNLATVHVSCHMMIHDNVNYESLVDKKTWKKILNYRTRLEKSES